MKAYRIQICLSVLSAEYVHMILANITQDLVLKENWCQRYLSEIKIWTIKVSISVFLAGTATGDKFLFDQMVSVSVAFGVTGSRVCMWSVPRFGAELLVLKDLRLWGETDFDSLEHKPLYLQLWFSDPGHVEVYSMVHIESEKKSSISSWSFNWIKDLAGQIIKWFIMLKYKNSQAYIHNTVQCQILMDFKLNMRAQETKVHLVKAVVFPVVMYGCESWTIKKTEHRRIDAF